MHDIELMARNLSQLIKETPDSEPVDPFQKRQFGRRMRKSASSVTPPCSLQPPIDSNQSVSMVQSIRVGPQHPSTSQSMDAPELEVYYGEVDRAMGKLKVSLPAVQAQYKEHIKQLYMTGSQQQLQSRADQLLSDLQGSIEFILRDCLNLNYQFRPTHHDKQNNRSCVNQAPDLPSRRSKDSKTREGRQEKSVYESILESRRVKRGRSGRRVV